MTTPAKQTPGKAPRFGKGQPAHYCGKKGKSGPKKGCLNALKNGGHLRRDGLVVGNIPIKAVRDQARQYRRKLDAVVVATRGVDSYEDLNPADKHGIHAATMAMAHAAICRWLLRTKLKEMSISDVRATSKEIANAAKDAAAAVKGLNLDAPPPVPWAIEASSQEADE